MIQKKKKKELKMKLMSLIKLKKMSTFIIILQKLERNILIKKRLKIISLNIQITFNKNPINKKKLNN